jgi:hypothetical protein
MPFPALDRRGRPLWSQASPIQRPFGIGLVPKQRSSGGKDKLGSNTKQGDSYLSACSPQVQVGGVSVALCQLTRSRVTLALSVSNCSGPTTNRRCGMMNCHPTVFSLYQFGGVDLKIERPLDLA